MIRFSIFAVTLFLFVYPLVAQQKPRAANPVIFADVPDMSMIRVGNVYYMSSTTMHMSPGVPVMKSTDLVNWKIINYCYDTLADIDELNLDNGKNTYGKGSWASSLRYHNGMYYLTTFSQSTGRTHVYTTSNIEKGNWKASSFEPSYHDHSLFFDDNGKVYMIYGSGKIRMIELKKDLSGPLPGSPDRVIIEDASTPAGLPVGLPSEGSQMFKINGKYYLFNIAWPRGGMRTVTVHRSDSLNGPYEGRLVFQDKGVAQGGLIDTKDGRWFAYLFRDYGAVGRIPYLVPVEWKDGWPVLGVNGKVPDSLDLVSNKPLYPGIVASDEFTRKKNDPSLPLVWQWNHQPDSRYWSVNKRPGFLRLSTMRVDSNILQVKNMLTQRVIGPRSFASTSIDTRSMKDGDRAGLCLLQKNYGFVAVEVEGDTKTIICAKVTPSGESITEQIPLKGSVIYFKAECDFRDMKDIATFYYSLDNKNWIAIGEELKMTYTLPHFMGYRYGLFNYSTKQPGGFADFDFFRIKNL
jgi:beta-xylosidase